MRERKINIRRERESERVEKVEKYIFECSSKIDIIVRKIYELVNCYMIIM